MKHIKLFEAFVNEAKLTKKDFDKVVKAVEKSKQPATVMFIPKFNEIEIIVGWDAPDSITDEIYPHLDKLKYGPNDVIIAGDSSNLSRREYDEIAKVNGGHKDY